MFILFVLIDIGFGVWVSLGGLWWHYLLNVFLLVLSGSFFCSHAVQDIARTFPKKSQGLGSEIYSTVWSWVYLVPAFYVFRNNLLLLLLWGSIKLAECYYTAWIDGLLNLNDEEEQLEERTK